MRSAQVIQLLLLVPSLAWGQTTDISGTWRGQANGPGGQSVPLMLTLRAEGGKLTGAFTGPPPDTAKPIVDGAINGDHLTFRVLGGGDPTEAPREFRFDATVSGGRMRGTVSNPRGMQIEFALEKDTSTGAAPEGGQPLHVGAAPGSPAAGVATPPVLTGPDPAPQPAVEAILGALDDHEVVALGSIAHGTLDMDHLVLDLLRDPRLPGKVQDIAVECGNALYQPLLDRYIAGGAVSLADVRQVWRNTSQPMECPFSLFYDALFPLVRRINQLLPAGSRLRVLACDPPIDWSRVHRPEDLHGLMGRDESIASVIENEVLARHRKALMLFGINHIRHGVGAVGIYEVTVPGCHAGRRGAPRVRRRHAVRPLQRHARTAHVALARSIDDQSARHLAERPAGRLLRPRRRGRHAARLPRGGRVRLSGPAGPVAHGACARGVRTGYRLHRRAAAPSRVE